MPCRPDHVTVPHACQHCGSPVELVYEAHTNRDTLLNDEYACPLCNQLTPVRINGKVVSVSDRPSRARREP